MNKTFLIFRQVYFMFQIFHTSRMGIIENENVVKLEDSKKLMLR